MADNIKISDLDALTAAQNSTIVPVVDGGTTKKMELSTLQTHLTASFATPSQLSTQISNVNSTISGLTTANVTENASYLYYTDARVDARVDSLGLISSSDGVDALQLANLSTAVLSVVNAEGVLSGSLTSADISDFSTAVSTSAALAGFGSGSGGGGGVDLSGTNVVSSSAQITSLGFISESISASYASYALTASYALNAAGGGGGGGTDYISNVVFSGTTFTFTGIGNAFSNSIDLSGENIATLDDLLTLVDATIYSSDSSSFASRISNIGAGSVPSGTVSSSAQTIEHINTINVVSASQQITTVNTDLTGLTIDDIGNGITNKYYSDSLVLSYINSIDVLSGSAGGGTWPVSGTPPNIVSSSAQIELLGFLTNGVFGSATESLQSQIDGIETGVSLNDENIFLAEQFFTQGMRVTGSILLTGAGASFSGSGALLSNIPAAAIVGSIPVAATSLSDGANSITANSVTGITINAETGSVRVTAGNLVISSGSVFSGSGAGLYDIPGSAIIGGVGGGTSIATGSVTASVDPNLGLIVNSDISASGDITARSISVGASGTPTIYSSNNLNLSASNAVVITDSPLRLTPFTNTITASFSFSNGDIVYSSTSDDFYGYKSGSLVSLTGGASDGVVWNTIVGIPTGLVSSSAQVADLGNGLVSSSNQIAPDAGTGDILFKNSLNIVTSSGDFRYTEGTETLTAPTMSVGVLSYNSLSGPSAATGSFNLVDTDRVLINNAVEMPTSDGSVNQVIKTNGSGITSFGDVAWGEISSLPSGILSSSNQLVELDVALEAQANTFTADQIISGNLYVTESVLADILILTAKDPLPTPLNSGSIAVSGSGAQMKPYFWNGIAWQAMI